MSDQSIKWAIKGVLARGCRPGWPIDTPSFEAIEEWLVEAKSLKVKSIICLLSTKELRRMYGDQGIDLLKVYRNKKLKVKHVPTRDHVYPALNKSQIDAIAAAFKKLPKPCLIHCSAGIERTGFVINNLLKNHCKILP